MAGAIQSLLQPASGIQERSIVSKTATKKEEREPKEHFGAYVLKRFKQFSYIPKS